MLAESVTVGILVGKKRVSKFPGFKVRRLESQERQSSSRFGKSSKPPGFETGMKLSEPCHFETLNP
jgi:hypothetical protein